MANVFICQYFYFLYIPILYIFQKGRTAFADISVGGLKISRVPRVGDLAGAAGKLQQLIYFVLRVGTDDTQDIADVGVIHADDVIVGVIIGFFHLYGAVAGAGNVVFPEYGHGSMVNRVSDLLGAGGRGGDVETGGAAAGGDHVFQGELGHGGTADAAVANKKYLNHI